MKAYVVLQCISGIGDQYTSVLSGCQIYRDLKALGYEVEITWDVLNQYFPSSIPLDCLFDQSCFEGNISYGKEPVIAQEYQLLPQLQNSIRIYVSEIIPELKTYEAHIYSYSWFFRKTITERNYDWHLDTAEQFLSQEVLNKVEVFRKNRTKIKGVHFRIQDTHINSTYEELENVPAYAAPIKRVKEFIEENVDQEVMLCSNNRIFVDTLTAEYSNTFQNYFIHDIPSYYSYTYKNANTRPVSDFIEHAQETAAEMAMFKYCDQILTYNTFHSSYLTYGIAYNVHHTDWKTKLRNLIL